MARYDVSLCEFECLLQLSLAPDSRLRMIDLAERMRLSPSGCRVSGSQLVDDV